MCASTCAIVLFLRLGCHLAAARASPPAALEGHAAGKAACSGHTETEEATLLQTVGKAACSGHTETEEATLLQTVGKAAGGGGSRYLPSVHAKGAGEAFDAVRERGGALAEVLRRYLSAGVQKRTVGRCNGGDCYGWRGPTDCLGGECLCQDGYGTRDGERCRPRLPEPLAGYNRDTGGTCGYFGCSSSRGEARCVGGACLCRDGLAAEDGRCIPPWRSNAAGAVVRTMLLAGAREPDEIACPGEVFHRGTMKNGVLQMAYGKRHFNVSLCRTAAQVYHASPLPMVHRTDLADAPVENGFKGSNAVKDFYALATLRQWRTHMARVVATEFVYAVALPDLAEGAKRLGNLLHTLSDSFSASHVQRAPAMTCAGLAVELPMSMDVMDFVVHPLADAKTDDVLYRCSRFYQEAAIGLWAEARYSGVGTAGGASRWAARLVAEVICPALPISRSLLDTPAGGASATYSADSWDPALPKGTAGEVVTAARPAAQEATMRRAREREPPARRRAFPLGLELPGRAEDACADAAAARVAPAHAEAALSGTLPPQYLQPYF